MERQPPDLHARWRKAVLTCLNLLIEGVKPYFSQLALDRKE